MSSKNDTLIEEAKEKLRKAAAKIKEKSNQSSEEEPEHLRSGHLDELELERRKRGKDDE